MGDDHYDVGVSRERGRRSGRTADPSVVVERTASLTGCASLREASSHRKRCQARALVLFANARFCRIRRSQVSRTRDRSMIERLLTFLRERMPLSRQHEDIVRSAVTPRRVKKGEFVQRAGEVARHGHFIARGCLRSFSIDEKGKEHVLQFAPEGWWLTDFASIHNQAPSTFFIEALEDSDLLLVDWPSHNRLIAELPGFAAAFAAGLQKQTTAREQRLLDSMSATAEQRYLRF